MRFRYRHAVLGLCLAAYFAIRFAQLVISPIVPALLDAFAVSRGEIGLALTGMWIAYALSQLPSGLLADRYGERRVVLVAVGLAGAGILSVAGATSFGLFVGVVILLGVGAGLYYNAATALLDRSFASVGTAIGTHRAGSQAAGLVTPIVAAVAVGYGWRAAPLLGAVAAGVVVVAFAAVVRPVEPAAPGTSLRAAIDVGDLGRLLSRPPIAYATAIAVLGEFALTATVSFLPTVLVEHHGLGLGTASLLFSVYFASQGIAQPASGWLSDRLDRDAVIAATLLAGAVGYTVLVVGTTTAAAAAAAILVGVAMSWSSPLQSRVMDDLSDADRGTGFGLVRTVYILAGALATTVVGATADLAGWAVAFGLLAGLLAVALSLIAANRLLRLGL